MKPTTALPDDAALPGLAAIREAGLSGILANPGFGDRPDEVVLRGYSPGDRATLEVRVNGRHLAVKVYAKNPLPEAALYSALAAAGVAGDSGPRVPPLLTWEPELRVLVMGWLEGPTVHELVKDGRPERAGELAASWIRRAASLRGTLGPQLGAGSVLKQAGGWVDALRGADPYLGDAGTALVRRLEQTQTEEKSSYLVHGTLYARHILDLGDGPGVIDWQRFGQGPLELDAGVFLSTIARIAVRHAPSAGAAHRARDAFLAGTRGLLEERVLAWYFAIALLRLASKPVTRVGAERLRARGRRDVRALGLGRAHGLLDEAARVMEVVA